MIWRPLYLCLAAESPAGKIVRRKTGGSNVDETGNRWDHCIARLDRYAARIRRWFSLRRLSMKEHRRLVDEYAFPGFVPQAWVKGKFGDPTARVIVLKRRSKKRRAGVVAPFTRAFTIGRNASSVIIPAAAGGYSSRWKPAVSHAASAGK